jgi:hypothetical protein
MKVQGLEGIRGPDVVPMQGATDGRRVTGVTPLPAWVGKNIEQIQIRAKPPKGGDAKSPV